MAKDKVVGTPTNINMLSPLGFKFMINKLPNTNFFIQSINLPGLNLGEVDTQTLFTRLPFAGDHITFQDLTISFRVDEDLANYRELFDWMVALGFPESYDQSRQIYNISNNITSAAGGNTVFSDATLMILNSAMQSNIQCTFKEIVPVSLSDIPFDVRAGDVDYVEATASFRYRVYNIETV